MFLFCLRTGSHRTRSHRMDHAPSHRTCLHRVSRLIVDASPRSTGCRLGELTPTGASVACSQVIPSCFPIGYRLFFQSLCIALGRVAVDRTRSHRNGSHSIASHRARPHRKGPPPHSITSHMIASCLAPHRRCVTSPHRMPAGRTHSEGSFRCMLSGIYIYT